MVCNIMVVLLFVMIAGILVNDRRSATKNDHVFLNKKSTGALRGIMVIMIVISHICQFDESLKYSLLGGTKTYWILFSGGVLVSHFSSCCPVMDVIYLS